MSKKESFLLSSRVIAAVLITLGIPTLFTIWTFTGGDPRGEWVFVARVIDGDTIGVGRGRRYQIVRLIGGGTRN